MKQPEIVNASKANFDALGETLKRGGRAIAAVLDGRTIGVAGYYLEKGRLIIFSTITPELRPYKRTIVRGARIVMGMAEMVQAPAHALANPVPGAETLLEHYGFERLEGNIFGRTPSWRRQVH